MADVRPGHTNLQVQARPSPTLPSAWLETCAAGSRSLTQPTFSPAARPTCTSTSCENVEKTLSSSTSAFEQTCGGGSGLKITILYYMVLYLLLTPILADVEQQHVGL